MRIPRITLVGAAVAVALAGCAAQPIAEPTPTPTTSPSPTATADGPTLPTVESALAALDSAAEDDRAPDIRLGVALAPGEPQFLEDLRTGPLGSGTVRVACTTEDGSDVSVEVSIGDAAPVTFAAPCAGSPESGTAIFTTQEQTFEFTDTYRFTVLSPVAATVAVGVIKNVPQ